LEIQPHISCPDETLCSLLQKLSMDSSDSVRTCFDKLRTDFSDPWIAFGAMKVWWWSFRAKNFQIFCLRKWCFNELSTAARMWNWSDWFISLWKKVSRSLICLFSVAFLKGRTGSYLLAGPCWLVKSSKKNDDCGMELAV
jgi:hypothetical protein